MIETFKKDGFTFAKFTPEMQKFLRGYKTASPYFTSYAEIDSIKEAFGIGGNTTAAELNAIRNSVVTTYNRFMHMEPENPKYMNSMMSVTAAIDFISYNVND